MINMELAQTVIERLLEAGVKEFCLCAGARNSPFVCIFDENKDLKTYHFFEERSAAFFALGRIAATRTPVAVITTSGTAVAELLPAAVEGTYSSLPLILVTADRPKNYRGTGAPQSIDQVGMFSYYIEASFDLDEENTHISLKYLSWKKPVHINVCFKEPLVIGEIPQIRFPKEIIRAKFPSAIPIHMVDEVRAFVAQHKPLVILSTIPERFRESVLQFITMLKAPVYVEGISSLRGHPSLKEFTLKSGEKILDKLIDERICDSVIRIGGVPTVRFWRDLEDKRSNLPVLSLGYNHFVGLSRTVTHFDNLEELSRIQSNSPQNIPVAVQEWDEKNFLKKKELLEKYPSSELGLIYHLSKHLSQSYVFLGNSLPVREWDLASNIDYPPLRMAGSRGANGIDGQVSTFLGWCRPNATNWCLIGDLTALYDLSALWVTPQMEKSQIRIVVINNKGGQIFNRMFRRPIFLNQHEIQFQSWAQMWNWSYQKWQKIPDQMELSDRQLIELEVSAEQTEAFWKEWDQLWQ